MILIVAAMQEELNSFKKYGHNIVEKKIDGIDVIELTIAKTSVILSLSGIGKINAAYTTTTLLNQYPIKLVINIGSAGGLQANQQVGDIVIADIIKQHDLYFGEDTYERDNSEYFAYPDRGLINKAQVIGAKLGLNMHVGEIVSGDQFITHDGVDLKRIHTYFKDAMCVEMESSAIGRVCNRRGVPFIVLRSLSDVPVKGDNELEFDTYLALASKNSALFTYEFIKKIRGI